jgi:hypothetical protein
MSYTENNATCAKNSTAQARRDGAKSVIITESELKWCKNFCELISKTYPQLSHVRFSRRRRQLAFRAKYRHRRLFTQYTTPDIAAARFMMEIYRKVYLSPLIPRTKYKQLLNTGKVQMFYIPMQTFISYPIIS